MVRFTCNGFQIFIFMILVAMGRSFSHARQVKEVKAAKGLTNERELVVAGDINFSLDKETQRDAIPNVEATETLNKIGRKMKVDDIAVKKTSKEKTRKSEQDRNSKSTMATHDGEQNWKDYFMADYRTPKSHPPKNN